MQEFHQDNCLKDIAEKLVKEAIDVSLLSLDKSSMFFHLFKFYYDDFFLFIKKIAAHETLALNIDDGKEIIKKGKDLSDKQASENKKSILERFCPCIF